MTLDNTIRTFSYSLSLSSFELEIYELFLALSLTKSYPNLNFLISTTWNIESYYEETIDSLKFVVTQGSLRISFVDNRPVDMRESIKDAAKDIFKRFPNLSKIQLDQLNENSSNFSILFSPVNSEKSKLDLESFIALYPFASFLNCSPNNLVQPIGIFPIRLDPKHLTESVKKDTLSKSEKQVQNNFVFAKSDSFVP